MQNEIKNVSVNLQFVLCNMQFAFSSLGSRVQEQCKMQNANWKMQNEIKNYHLILHFALCNIEFAFSSLGSGG